MFKFAMIQWTREPLPAAQCAVPPGRLVRVRRHRKDLAEGRRGQARDRHSGGCAMRLSAGNPEQTRPVQTRVWPWCLLVCSCCACRTWRRPTARRHPQSGTAARDVAAVPVVQRRDLREALSKGPQGAVGCVVRSGGNVTQWQWRATLRVSRPRRPGALASQRTTPPLSRGRK